MSYFADASPDPKSHIKTLMRIGYTMPSAISDIIDNSLTANASNISIYSLPSLAEPNISILDDGDGMSPQELIHNMKIGCKDPSDERLRGDLGRFGSGMKTASFSQARRLTVFSKRQGHPICAAVWDIDQILGYKLPQAQKAVKSVSKPDMSTEVLIKESLKSML